LLRAAEAGRAKGLQFVYAGNLPVRVGTFERTRCRRCDGALTALDGFAVRRNRVTGGCCPDCGEVILGVWWPGDARRRTGR